MYLVFVGILETRIILPESDNDKRRNVSDSSAKRNPDNDRNKKSRTTMMPVFLSKAESCFISQTEERFWDFCFTMLNLIFLFYSWIRKPTRSNDETVFSCPDSKSELDFPIFLLTNKPAP